MRSKRLNRPMPKEVGAARDPKAIGQRLGWLIKAVRLRKGRFADDAGIGRSTLSNYLSGKSRPDLEHALRIVEKYEISLDWLYLSSTAGMPDELLDKIRTVELTELALKQPKGKVMSLRKRKS